VYLKKALRSNRCAWHDLDHVRLQIEALAALLQFDKKRALAAY